MFLPSMTELLIIALMILLNAFFAAYEMALASISRARIFVLVNQKRKGAPEAAFMKDRMEASLAVVQLGITLVGAIAAATGGAGVSESLAPYLETHFHLSHTTSKILSLMFLIIPLSLLTIIFAELIPKMFALKNNEKVCLALSPGMKILSIIFYPVVLVLETIVKFGINLVSRHSPHSLQETGLHELNAAVSLARAARLIGAREEKIVLSAAKFSVRRVKEIIIPINNASMIPVNATLTDALVRAHMDMHTRFPVCSPDNPKEIHGYVNFKDIMTALHINPENPTIQGIIRPIKTINADTAISVALEKMIQEKQHIALVEENGSILGMITLEDIIEELVGEIEDEFDRQPAYIHAFSGGWIMGGGVPMKTFMQELKLDSLPGAEQDNLKLSDWTEHKIGHPLKGGETVKENVFQITVRKLRRGKLGEALVTKIPS